MGKKYVVFCVILLTIFSSHVIFTASENVLVTNKACCDQPIMICSEDINKSKKGFVIKNPGHYIVCDNVIFKPSKKHKTQAAITIASSNVTLDLGGNALSYSLPRRKKSSAIVAGIMIESSAASVSIQNGSITDFTGAGILYQQNEGIQVSGVTILRTGVPSSYGGLQINDSSDIVIDNVIALNNFGSGMYLHGVIKATVSNSHFDDNVGGNVAPQLFTGPGLVASGVYVDSSPNTETSDVLFQDCTFNRNSAGSDAGGMEVGPYTLLPVRNITVLRCEFLDNFMTGELAEFNDASGLVLVFVTDYVIKDVVASGQRHPFPPGGLVITSGATGISINACNNGVIENCQAFDNVGQGASSIGIRARGCNNLLVKNCEASANINTGSGEAFGFYTDPEHYVFFPSLGTANIFKDCVAQQNSSVTGLAGGFKFANLACSVMENCISQSNAIGIVVTDYNSPNLALNNIFKENIVQCNTVSGINDQLVTSNNAYIGNIARSNGPAGVTNYVRLPAGTPIAVWNLPGAFPVGASSFTNLDIRP